jgi:hypothetical protein
MAVDLIRDQLIAELHGSAHIQGPEIACCGNPLLFAHLAFVEGSSEEAKGVE